jgi:OsmC-like protein
MSEVVDRIRNGVNTEVMYGTLDAIKADPSLGEFQFRARNHWIDGAHNRSTIKSFYGAGQEDAQRGVHARRRRARRASRRRHRPEPGRVPAARPGRLSHDDARVCRRARKVRLTDVESTLEGDMDVRGCLGLSDEVRNGFSRIRATFTVKGDAPPEKLREIVERAQARSAVFDMVSHGVPVEVGVNAG